MGHAPLTSGHTYSGSIFPLHCPDTDDPWCGFNLTGTKNVFYAQLKWPEEVVGLPELSAVAFSPGQELWDTRRLSPGVYSVEFFNGAELHIHPNPASTWVAIDYDLLVEPTDAALIIRDMTGREVKRIMLREQQQQVVWDTRQAAPGSYTVVLQNKQRQLRAEKLIIRQ